MGNLTTTFRTEQGLTSPVILVGGSHLADTDREGLLFGASVAGLQDRTNECPYRVGCYRLGNLNIPERIPDRNALLSSVCCQPLAYVDCFAYRRARGQETTSEMAGGQA